MNKKQPRPKGLSECVHGCLGICGEGSFLETKNSSICLSINWPGVGNVHMFVDWVGVRNHKAESGVG